ncbi:hypothetical protein SOASR030_19510 [Leminorella grimontii]|uniref:Uncharacterized protein n=1 Tax=Leminorella grimontii TaxID=82981 RepID=A0AAV5N2A1_9GAMM|nr:hypothetical protein [Leminorella grimontii]KFC93469.1 hypothetical protein GLGR_3032 [Leminorella grimontii ATCC 33999 = DSM 5078]GKX55839.1 hypothetical protein SOASR030_19510 [Leminorella grimontii]VFS55059.1 Uncharacterised protein [Leminorella grimontii]
MNHIDICAAPTPHGYSEDYLTIDGIPIVDCLEQWVSESKHDALPPLKSLKGLYPAWGPEMMCRGERLFIQELLQSPLTQNVPILVCEDDLDLSCLVIVAKVRKEAETVHWDGIGLFQPVGMNNEDEAMSGMLRFGERWRGWVSERWDEERLMRCRNYVNRFLQRDENILWIAHPGWRFEKRAWEQCVSFYQSLVRD